MYERCENCFYCKYDEKNDGYVCVNDNSDYCTDCVDEYHWCEEWMTDGD